MKRREKDREAKIVFQIQRKCTEVKREKEKVQLVLVVPSFGLVESGTKSESWLGVSGEQMRERVYSWALCSRYHTGGLPTDGDAKQAQFPPSCARNST